MKEKQIADTIDSLTIELERLKELAFPEHAKERLKDGLCLSCGKKLKTKPIRGCDANCYRNIKRDIDSGKYTEGMAIASGLWSPEQKSGRKTAPEGMRAKLIRSVTENQVSTKAETKNNETDIDKENRVIVGRKRKPTKKRTTRSSEERKHG